jgi:hypothetical protein
VWENRYYRNKVFPRQRRTLTMFMPSKEDSSQYIYTYASAQRSMAGAGTQSGLQGAPSRNHPTRGRNPAEPTRVQHEPGFLCRRVKHRVPKNLPHPGSVFGETQGFPSEETTPKESNITLPRTMGSRDFAPGVKVHIVRSVTADAFVSIE